MNAVLMAADAFVSEMYPLILICTVRDKYAIQMIMVLNLISLTLPSFT